MTNQTRRSPFFTKRNAVLACVALGGGAVFGRTLLHVQTVLEPQCRGTPQHRLPAFVLLAALIVVPLVTGLLAAFTVRGSKLRVCFTSVIVAELALLAGLGLKWIAAPQVFEINLPAFLISVIWFAILGFGAGFIEIGDRAFAADFVDRTRRKNRISDQD